MSVVVKEDFQHCRLRETRITSRMQLISTSCMSTMRDLWMPSTFSTGSHTTGGWTSFWHKQPMMTHSMKHLRPSSVTGCVPSMGYAFPPCSKDLNTFPYPWLACFEHLLCLQANYFIPVFRNSEAYGQQTFCLWRQHRVLAICVSSEWRDHHANKKKQGMRSSVLCSLWSIHQEEGPTIQTHQLWVTQPMSPS